MVCKSATFSFSPTKRPIQNPPKSIQNDTKRVLRIFSKSHGIRQLVSLFQGTHLGRRALPRTCPTPPGTRGRFAITLLSPSRSTNREPANWRRQPPTGVIFLGQFSRGSEAPEAPLAGGPGRPKLGPTYPLECGGALPQLFLPVFFSKAFAHSDSPKPGGSKSANWRRVPRALSRGAQKPRGTPRWGLALPKMSGCPIAPGRPGLGLHRRVGGNESHQARTSLFHSPTGVNRRRRARPPGPHDSQRTQRPASTRPLQTPGLAEHLMGVWNTQIEPRSG